MAWLLSGLLVGPIIYIFVILFTPRLRTVEEYQFGERKLNPSDVVDASMMYGFQIAAIALFSTWGYLYGATALVVPAFWALGYIVFSKALSDRFLSRFVTGTRFRTLHGFLADHNRIRSVRVTAALLTLVGLAGPAMVEAFTVGRSLAAAAPSLGAVGGAGLALSFLAISLTYMTRGGFPGVVRLNQLQMMLGYGGFCVFTSGAMCLFIGTTGAGPVFWLSTGGLLTCTALAAIKIKHDVDTWRYVRNFRGPEKPLKTADILGLASVLVGVLSFVFSSAYSLTALDFNFANAQPPALLGTSTAYGFTLLATLSLFVANAFYQFVDVTQWQRLLSLASDPERLQAASKMLRSNVLAGGFCSALTWVLAIGFGIFLHSVYNGSHPDPYGLVPAFVATLVNSSSSWSGPLLFITAAALLAIMFSTLDAIIAATAFTVQEDLLGVGEGKHHTLNVARGVTVGVVVAQLLFYLLIGAASGDRIDAVLYICWSFQLAMMPVVAGLLMGRSGPYWARIASMLGGCLGALSPLFLGDANQAYEVSPTAALIVATAIYLACGGGRRQSTPEAAL